MKKHLLISLLFIIYSFGNAQIRESDSQTENALTQEQKELIFEKAKAFPDKAQLSIALIENGEVKFYGIKRRKDSTVAINNYQRVFEIGSITKVFTGTLLANSVIDKKIKLKNDINEYLGYFLKDSVGISFEQLATHTAGLPRVPPSLETVSLANPYKGYGEERLKTYLTEELEMLQSPGEKCEYSNLGVGLLGYLLEKITHISYEKMLQAKIFSKYKMVNSTTDRNKIKDRLVMGLNDEGTEVPNWDMEVFMGAGGILSSVEDLSIFALAQFDDENKELRFARTSFFKISENFSMGLGWSIITVESGAKWNWHNGGTGGYTSSMIIDTKAKSGVIILSNISAIGELATNVTSLCPELMDTFN